MFCIVVDVFGMLYVPPDPSLAAPVWLPKGFLLEGPAGRIEIVGDLWILLVTWAALPAGRLPRALNHLGVVIGVAGILDVVPALGVLGMGFRLGEMVWGVWLGIVWVRGSQRAAAREVRAFLKGTDAARREDESPRTLRQSRSRRFSSHAPKRPIGRHQMDAGRATSPH